MLTEDIARLCENMARVLAFSGKGRFRIMAYERAAVSVNDLEEDLAAIVYEAKLDVIPGIGKELSERIEEYGRTRKIRRYEHERDGLSHGLVGPMSIPGLGANPFALLHKKFRVNCPNDFRIMFGDGGTPPEAPSYKSRKSSASHAAAMGRR